jgi:hypothetical protein
MATKAHFVLQGKGGAGKTFVSWLLAQHRQAQDSLSCCFDIDQQNPMLSSYSSLAAATIDLSAKADASAIDRAKFDTLTRSILDAPREVVIDTGAKEFSSLVGYMANNDIVELLADSGTEVSLHVVVAGSDMLSSCMSSLDLVLGNLGSSPASIYVWLNDHHGDLNFGEDRTFEETNFYQSHKQRLAGLIYLERLPGEFAKKLSELREMCMTFDDALKPPAGDVIMRSRVQRLRQKLFAQLDAILPSYEASSGAANS